MKLNAFLRTALVVSVVLMLAACAREPVNVSARVVDSDIVAASYVAADSLLEQVPYLREGQHPLLTATFVNVNSLENSSSLGRIVAEQISSRFAQRGFTMVEMKLRNNVFIEENAGEFVLSRSVQEISQAHNAAAVIAGTYAVGRQSVYINARLVRAADNLVLAAYDYTLPMGPDTRALLAGGF